MTTQRAPRMTIASARRVRLRSHLLEIVRGAEVALRTAAIMTHLRYWTTSAKMRQGTILILSFGK